jgi:hypothetical protein
MMLTSEELKWVSDRMQSYTIRYQEIYNELLDHVITAIEEKRKAGDSRAIDIVFEEVVSTNFGGCEGMETIARSYETEYRAKVSNLLKVSDWYYINMRSAFYAMAILLISYIFRDSDITRYVLFVSLLFAASYPPIYMFMKLRDIRPSKGKKSLIYLHIRKTVVVPYILVNAQLYLSVWNNKHGLFNLTPLILVPILALLVVYGLGRMRLCNQEVGSFVNIETVN